MARFFRLTFVWFALALGVGLAGPAVAGVYASQSVAYSACTTRAGQSTPPTGYTYVCNYFVIGPDSGLGAPPCTSTQKQSGADYEIRRSDGFNPQIGDTYHWCLPTVCTAGNPVGDSDTAWDVAVPSGQDCIDGCLYAFHPSTDKPAWCYSDGQCQSYGYFQRTSQTCSSTAAGSSPVVPAQPQPKPCGGSSCYDPSSCGGHGGFVASTDSGEQVTACGQPGGGCGSGATGAVCTGPTGDVPKPGDPPIPNGQSPSGTDTGTSSATDTGGTTTVTNTTINVYNGTDTSSGSGSGGSAPGSSSSTGVGGGSNTSGNGNTGQTGTDGNGKCPNGSVPTASGCSGTFSDSNCDSPPACYGDAVLCGVGKETWATRCGVQKTYEFMSDRNGVPVASGSIAASAVIHDVDDTSTFDESGLGWSRACPSNPTFEVLGKVFTFDLSGMCGLFNTAGIIVLVGAYLTGLGIVARV